MRHINCNRRIEIVEYGDIIAELTGMGKALFGFILMAVLTLLPELFTGFSSIVLIHSPHIAVGDIMGFVLLTFLYLPVSIFTYPRFLFSLVTKGHLLAGLRL